MKKIVVNGRFLLHRITGVERYARELLLELDNVVEKGQVELAIPPGVVDLPNYNNIAIKRVGSLNNRLWEHISFPLYVRKQKGISLNLCNVSPLISPGLVFIYDMKIKAHPEFFSWKFRLWYELLFYNSARRAKMIFTDSEFAKSEIIKYYPFVDEDKIKVIYAGWQHMNRIEYDDNSLEKYDLKENDFYFALGSMDPNKNFEWIAKQAKNNPDEIFVISGSINESIFASGFEFVCPENLKILGYISDQEIKALMKNCKAFLFPSIYEGFGIPPLEAMSAGAKCIVVSNTEVMHEIFGESVNYIDPNSYDFSSDSLNRIDESDIKIILNKYNWKKSSQLLVDSIMNIDA